MATTQRSVYQALVMAQAAAYSGLINFYCQVAEEIEHELVVLFESNSSDAYPESFRELEQVWEGVLDDNFKSNYPYLYKWCNLTKKDLAYTTAKDAI